METPLRLMAYHVGSARRADDSEDNIPRRLAVELGVGDHVHFGPVLSLHNDTDAVPSCFVSALFEDLKEWSIPSESPIEVACRFVDTLGLQRALDHFPVVAGAAFL